ncbi:MAG: hypothetical protein IJP74_01835 [Prevotella sp.]|nr:hypothetical protein [Prevotella sp.]
MLNVTEFGAALTTLQQAMTDFVALNSIYDVTFAPTIADGDKWTATPDKDVTEGTTVTLNYTGKKKVKSITVTKN